jgi:hypothetical protein
MLRSVAGNASCPWQDVGEGAALADLVTNGLAVVALVGVDKTGIRQLLVQGFTGDADGDIAPSA